MLSIIYPTHVSQRAIAAAALSSAHDHYPVPDRPCRAPLSPLHQCCRMTGWPVWEISRANIPTPLGRGTPNNGSAWIFKTSPSRCTGATGIAIRGSVCDQVYYPAASNPTGSRRRHKGVGFDFVRRLCRHVTALIAGII